MEVFVRDIPLSTLDDAFEHAVRKQLLGLPGGTVNFQSSLFKNTHGRSRGIATVLIASLPVGRAFLAQKDLQIKAPDGGLHFCRLSLGKRNPPPAHVVADLSLRPYKSPTERRKEEGQYDLGEEVEAAVSLSSAGTAFRLRDGSLSLEWSVNTPFGQASYHKGRADFGLAFHLRRSEGPLAVVTGPTVVSVTLDESSKMAHIHLSQSPTFLQQEQSSDSSGESRLFHRLSAWHPTHAPVAPFASRHLLLNFNSSSALEHFQSLCHNASFPLPSHASLVVHKDTKYFSSEKVGKITKRISKLSDFRMAFEVGKLLRNQLMHTDDVFSLLSALRAHFTHTDASQVVQALQQLSQRLSDALVGCQPCRTADEWKAILDRLLLLQQNTDGDLMQREAASGSLMLVSKVLVTPTAVLLDGPTWEASNRVLRRYRTKANYFLRVNFCDEDLERYFPATDVDNMAFVHERYGTFLKRGIEVGGKHYDMLAWSNSSLKTQDSWFVAPFKYSENGRSERVTAQSIRDSIGDFSKLSHYPARKAARISQAFSATAPSVTLRSEDILEVPDKTFGNNNFTDGVGTMSFDLCVAVTDALNRERPTPLPSLVEAIQFRLGGFKGMLSLHDQLRSHKMCPRPSMNKFKSDSLELEVSEIFLRPLPYFFNRPLINILEDLGVPASEFLTRQARCEREARSSARSLRGASDLMASHSIGQAFGVPKLLSLMRDTLGLELSSSGGPQSESGRPRLQDSFLDSCLHLLVTEVLSELKHKARIRVPGSYCLVGIADEYDIIPENQIFARIQEDGHSTPRLLTGEIALSRSPAIHPGDIALVQGLRLDPPSAARYPRNCVVFSCKGKRPLASCLGGGDLDGDLYTLLMDRKLHPRYTSASAEYPPAPDLKTSLPCSSSDLADHFLSYMVNDCVARLAISHLRLAAESPRGTFSKSCLKISSLHSVAVDFQKTGLPVPPEQVPRAGRREKPDFLAPRGKLTAKQRKSYYESPRIVGQLFRQIELPRELPKHARSAEQEEDGSSSSCQPSESHEMISDLVETALEDDCNLQPQARDRSYASDLFNDYKDQLNQICGRQTSETRLAKRISEEEAFMGILTSSSVAGSTRPKQRQEHVRLLQDQTSLLTAALLHDLRGQHKNGGEGGLRVSSHDPRSSDETMRRSWACWSYASLRCDFGAATFGWMSLYSLLVALKLRGGQQHSEDI